MDTDYKKEFLNKLKEIIAKAEKVDLGDIINDIEDLIEEYSEEENY